MFTKKLALLTSVLVMCFIACKKTSNDSSNDFVVTTLAGGATGFADGRGTAAKFSGPKGIATDVSANVYVADVANYRIRKISPSGLVTTLAGNGNFGHVDGSSTTAQFSDISGIAADDRGNVYATEFNQIRKITPAGEVSTLTNGNTGYADGNLSTAKFNDLRGIALDVSGNIYVVDCNGIPPYVGTRIRKIALDGTVSTVAGNGLNGYVEGNGNVALFSSCYGITVDPQGILYVADFGNLRVRKITPAGLVSSILSAGDFSDGPIGVCSDSQGNIFVNTNLQIYEIPSSGLSKKLIAGTKRGYADGNGNVASFNGLQGIALDALGDIFVTDYLNDRVRKISKK
jgi:sugar lactone lactonase YvrE